MLTSAQTNQFTDLFGDEDLIYNAHILGTTQHIEVFATVTIPAFTIQRQQTSISVQTFLLILSSSATSPAKGQD